MNIIRLSVFLFSLLIAAGFSVMSFAVSAQEPRADGPSGNIAIGGYSPVSYFEKGYAEPGLPEFSASYAGKTYYLSSEEQLAAFLKDPERYKPLFDLCPYSLTLGRRVAIDPTRFKIVGGHLLLFHNSEEIDALKEWNSRGDDAGQLERARRQYDFFEKEVGRSPNRSR